MKRNFSAVAAAFVLCIAMLFSGCREGGYEFSSGYSTEESIEELDVGERSKISSFSSQSSSLFSSSSVEESISSSIASSSVTSSSASAALSTQTSSSSSGSSPMTSSGFDAPIVVIISSRSSSADSSDKISSSAPIVVVVPEEPATSSSIAADTSDIDIPAERDDDNIGDVGEDPPDNNDIPAIPNESSSIVEESSASSSVTPEPITSEPETSVSPYDYEGTVYVAASGKGTRYHINPNCSNMKGSVGMEVRDALVKGYTPCKKCW